MTVRRATQRRMMSQRSRSCTSASVVVVGCSGRASIVRRRRCAWSVWSVVDGCPRHSSSPTRTPAGKIVRATGALIARNGGRI